MLSWHKMYYKKVQKALGISGYAMGWLAFIKGLVVGLLIAIWIS